MNSKFMGFTTATVIVVGLALWLDAKLALGGEVPVPPDFFYEETKPLDPVPFSHKSHVTGKKLQCPECHTKPFQMKKLAASPQMTMKVLNEGEFCGNCHNGKKAFSTKEAKDCSKCHQKK